MSFVTICPACKTAFKIAQSQLDASDGWVRCGHCLEIFDATQRIDLNPPAVKTTQPDPQVDLKPSKRKLEGATNHPPTRVQTQTEGHKGEVVDEWALPDRRIQHGQAPVVGFIEQAKRQHFWQRSAVRALLVLVGLLLAVLLALQVAKAQSQRFKQSLQTMSWAMDGMNRLCQQWDCEPRAKYDIDALVVEHSNLQKMGDKGSTKGHRLSVTIKNNGADRVVLPALELSLTDLTDNVIVRKVLTPQELGHGQAWIAPQSDARLVLDIKPQSSNLNVVGYRVVIFYP